MGDSKMMDLWMGILVWISIVFLIGCVLSSGLFLVKAWEHINRPQAVIKCHTINGSPLEISGDVTVTLNSIIAEGEKKG